MRPRTVQGGTTLHARTSTAAQPRRPCPSNGNHPKARTSGEQRKRTREQNGRERVPDGLLSGKGEYGGGCADGHCARSGEEGLGRREGRGDFAMFACVRCARYVTRNLPRSLRFRSISGTSWEVPNWGSTAVENPVVKTSGSFCKSVGI